MLTVFFFLAVFGGVISYMNIDPMKSSFFLICSLLFSMPIISFGLHIWFSYFICLLFLSGIFVILVYFSSLSKFSVAESKMFVLCFFLSMFFLFYDMSVSIGEGGLSLSGFYCKVYWFVFLYILVVLVFFMNFSSFFLNFSGALRKI
uniref:NADH dehydrogenase subunit 6 n=1 Tax=Rhabdias kafunata TaxID=2605646 RepID=UPI0023D85B28|nr:NADH dehydrogenase subunit 6 [Rhabdias kafunata]WCQ82425.1 NADH dehydrogenase subunit 6 [Rhabdias kafunata]